MSTPLEDRLRAHFAEQAAREQLGEPDPQAIIDRALAGPGRSRPVAAPDPAAPPASRWSPAWPPPVCWRWWPWSPPPIATATRSTSARAVDHRERAGHLAHAQHDAAHADPPPRRRPSRSPRPARAWPWCGWGCWAGGTAQAGSTPRTTSPCPGPGRRGVPGHRGRRPRRRQRDRPGARVARAASAEVYGVALPSFRVALTAHVAVTGVTDIQPRPVTLLDPAGYRNEAVTGLAASASPTASPP